MTKPISDVVQGLPQGTLQNSLSSEAVSRGHEFGGSTLNAAMRATDGLFGVELVFEGLGWTNRKNAVPSYGMTTKIAQDRIGGIDLTTLEPFKPDLRLDPSRNRN